MTVNENSRTIVRRPAPEPPGWYTAAAWACIYAAVGIIILVMGRVILQTAGLAVVLFWLLFLPVIHGYFCPQSRNARYRIGGRR